MGGIASGAHALEFVSSGATLVAVGTESFRDPAAGLRIRAELESGLANSGFAIPERLRGRALVVAREPEKGLQSEKPSGTTERTGLDLNSSFR